MFTDISKLPGVICQWDEETISEAYPCPSHVTRRIRGIISVTSAEAIQPIFLWAQQNKVTLYPISTGKNWGYGGGVPVQNDCIILDLSSLKKISQFNQDLGLITIEPGVTQAQLYEFIESHEYPFFTPATGSSPDCSLIGNALERGYGIAPITDHFMAIQSVYAVLPNGEVFDGLLKDFQNQAGSLGKWGVGPYLDGLFSQSNMGIILSATLRLVRKANDYSIIIFEPKSTGHFFEMVARMQAIKDSHAGAIGSVKLFNRYFSLSLSEPFPRELIGKSSEETEKWFVQRASETDTPEWRGIIFVHGTQRVVRATNADCKKALRTVTRKLTIAPKQLLTAIRTLLPLIPTSAFKDRLNSLSGLARLMQGEPQTRFLKAAYWRAGKIPETGEKWDPGRDGCGLIWFAPFLPFKGEDLVNLQAITKSVCNEYGFFPIFSLTSISDRAVTALVPILFDPATDLDRANACHRALFEACQQHGYLPYRAHINSMSWYAKQNNSFYWNTVEKMKRETDPDAVMAPGRYDGTIQGKVTP